MNDGIDWAKGTVLLVFPDFDDPPSVFGVRARSYGPPLGILFLASQLEAAGYQVKVVDFSAVPYSIDLMRKLLEDVDFVGISSLSYSQESLRRIARDVRQIDASIPVIMGGPACTIEAKLAQEMNMELQFPEDVDLMVIGEAEPVIVDILDNWPRLAKGNDRHSPTDWPAMILRDGSGEMHWLGTYREPTDLDHIERPAFHLADHEPYTLFGKKAPGVLAPIITSRGCPYRCRFCNRATSHIPVSDSQNTYSDHGLYQSFRLVSVSNVLEEIESLYNSGFKILYIVDDNFTAHRDRVHRIMDGIIQRRIQMAIIISARVDRCSQELYCKMREAGVQMVSFGLESGNQEVLDYYQKGTTVEQAYEAVELADRVGMLTHGTFILGAPMETEKHLRKTIDFACDLPLDFALFGILDYTYGCQLWKEAYAEGLIKPSERNVLACSERGLGKIPRDRLLKILRRTDYTFYLRARLWKRYINKLRHIEPEFSRLLIRCLMQYGADFLTGKKTITKQYSGGMFC